MEKRNKELDQLIEQTSTLQKVESSAFDDEEDVIEGAYEEESTPVKHEEEFQFEKQEDLGRRKSFLTNTNDNLFEQLTQKESELAEARSKHLEEMYELNNMMDKRDKEIEDLKNQLKEQEQNLKKVDETKEAFDKDQKENQANLTEMTKKFIKMQYQLELQKKEIKKIKTQSETEKEYLQS